MSDDELITWALALSKDPKLPGVQTVMVDRGMLRRLARLAERGKDHSDD